MSTENYPWIENYDRGIDWNMPLEPRPVFSLLDDAAKNMRTAPPSIFLEKNITGLKFPISRTVSPQGCSVSA
jgi:hypothetical protein